MLGAEVSWNELLRGLRRAAGLTQAEWSALISAAARPGSNAAWSTDSIGRWERGEHPPNAATAEAIVTVCRDHRLFEATGTEERLLRTRLAEANLAVTRRPSESARAAALASNGDGEGSAEPDQTSGGHNAYPPVLVSREAEMPARRSGMDPSVAGEEALFMPAPTGRVHIDAATIGPAAAELRTNNLPAHISSFVGREDDIAGVIRALRAARLVTLVGSGGCGKTRLAVEACTRALLDYVDGVWFVELAPLTDPELVPSVTLDALGRHEVADQTPLSVLEDYLRQRQALLVLDNCEHLVEGCVQLAYALLRACPRLRILATSREPLHITGERLCRLSTLPVPPETVGLAPRPLSTYAAVQLFVDRARLVRPEFELNESSAPAVARICRQLDGHPLALELAAARLRTLSAEQIATRLDDRFRLLVGGSRAVAPRQRTLRATLDWSHGLLSPSEQALLRRLSVFAGGWTLEAAERIAEPGGAAEALEHLTGLVDKSLVQVGATADLDELRYSVLETVRQYAAEHLSAAGELETTRARHLAWAINWAEISLPRLNGRDQLTWMRRIALEHDNFRVALEWSAATGDGDAELRLAAPLGHYWHLHGPSSEGRAWLSHALARAPAGPSLARAQALNWSGRMATMHGESGDDRLLSQAVAMADELGAYEIAARARRYLALAVQRRHETELTRSLYEEALRTARQGGVRLEEAFALAALGFLLAQSGDLSGAVPLIDEALAVGSEVGDVVPVSEALAARGIVATREERWADAARLFEEALRLGEAIGDSILIVRSRAQLAMLGPAGRDLTGARIHARACITAAQNSGHQRLISAALECYAELELEAGWYHLGVRLLAAVHAWRDASHVRHHGGGAPWMTVPSRLEQARAMLGEAAFMDAWSTGTLLSLESATTEAMEEMDLLARGEVNQLPKC